MDVVEVQCGSCGQMMGVSVEYLGTQVHCPHCQAVLQVPASATPAQKEQESIFSPPEEPSDLFGSTATPKVELPPPKMPRMELDEPRARGEPPLDATVDMGALQGKAAARKSVPFQVQQDADDPTDPGASMETGNLPKSPLRRPQPSMVVPYIFMFLIPYCLATTAFIAYLLYQRQTQVFDPLERLLDPNPEDGGPKKVKQGEKYSYAYPHDLKVPDKLKTKLHTPLSIGAIEVTPLLVQLTKEGNLTLRLRLRNLSQDQAFKPMSDAFLRFTRSSPRPYTFLETGSKYLFGGYLEWQLAEGKLADGILYPGQDMLVKLTTLDSYQDEVQKALKSTGSLLWRVQVRRGLVQVRGRPVSATAVIGVQFPTTAIEKEAA